MPAVGRAIVWAAFIVAAAAVLLQAAKVNLRSDQDKQFDFKAVRTWGWDVSEQGDVKMARSAEDDPAAIKRQFGPTIVDAVTRELTERGLAAGDASKPPDLRFHYYLIVTVGVNAQ